jgi:oxepin-CoA hydrolase/3-oxo-5,6-dehydrosuberyl-CoA semialdehyde dehydrogenase
MTQKTGQKCTAIRRIFVPSDKLAEVRDLLVERLSEVRVGNPADDKATMGPLATASQLKDVRAGIDKLAQGGTIALGGAKPIDGLGAPAGKGYFVTPTLVVKSDPKPNDPVHTLEVFGPVASLLSYGDTAILKAQVAAGGGGLVSSVYSDDKAFLQDVVLGIAAHHGRVTIGNEKLAGQSVPPGTVMPQLLHGGPGRAGGGEELGGLRGMALYMQRVALQGHRALIEQMVGLKKDAAAT